VTPCFSQSRKKMSKLSRSTVLQTDSSSQQLPDFSAYLACLAISALLHWGHGFNDYNYLVYVVDETARIVDFKYYEGDLFVEMLYYKAPVLNWVMERTEEVLMRPNSMMVISFLVKSLGIFFLYLVSNHFLKNSFMALFMTFLFMCSEGYSTRGVIPSGLWGGLILPRSTLSNIITLYGLLLLLKRFWFLSAVVFFISIQVHLMYGVVTLAYIVPGYLFFHFNKKLPLTRLLPFLIIPFNVLLTSAQLWDGFSMAEYLDLSINDWYKYVFSMDPDDMSFIYSTLNYGHTLFPLLLGGLICAFHQRKVHPLQWNFLIGGALVFLISMTLELLHFLGIFLPMLSEPFIGAQMRRGLWILLFLSAISILHFTVNTDFIKTKVGSILTNTCASVYIFPQWIGVLTVFILITARFRNIKSAILLVVCILSTLIGYQYGKLDSFLLTQGAVWVSISTLSVARVFRQPHSSASLIGVPILVFSMALIARGFTGLESFHDQSNIKTNGLFSKVDHAKLIRKVSKNSPEAHLVDAILNLNPARDPILIPPEIMTYSSRYLFKCPIYLSQNDFSMPMFSKNYLRITMQKMEDLGMKKAYDELAKHKFTKGDFYNMMKLEYRNLSSERLAFIKEKYNCKIMITLEPRLDRKPIFQTNLFFVYRT